MIANIILKKVGDRYFVVIDNGYGNKLYLTDKLPKDEALKYIESFKNSEIIEEE